MDDASSPLHLCECGCGQPTRQEPQAVKARGLVKGQYRRFVSGHQYRDPNRAARIAAAKSGRGNGRLGSHHSPETKVKISQAHRGQKRPANSAAQRGKPKSPEHREAIRQAALIRGQRERETRIRVVPARDGDQAQANERISTMVKLGQIPKASVLPCVDCGHVYDGIGRGHEYDHYLGYAAEHHEDVEAVCSPCHRRRERERGRVRKSSLPSELLTEIRDSYARGEGSYAQLGVRFSLTKTRIAWIITRAADLNRTA